MGKNCFNCKNFWPGGEYPEDTQSECEVMQKVDFDDTEGECEGWVKA